MLIFSVTALATPANPAIVFQHDFENEPLHEYTKKDLHTTWKVQPGKLAIHGSVAIVRDPHPSGTHGHVMRVFFAADTIHTRNKSGCFWGTPLGLHDELYLAYDVYFEEDVEFTLGGKLPGLGIPDYFSRAGRKPDGTDRWTGSMSWQKGGAVQSYVYHANQPRRYGDAIKWDLGPEGRRHFRRGAWNRLEIHYKMNTPGVLDGRLRGWFNGELAVDTNRIMWRMPGGEHLKIGSLIMISMYGGGDHRWAPTKDQHFYFDNFVVSKKPITHKAATQFDSVPVPPGRMAKDWYARAKLNYTTGTDLPVNWPALYARTPASQRIVVSDADALKKALKSAKPGDMILLKSGTWSAPNMRVTRSGTAAKPIILTSEAKARGVPGEVVIDGGHRAILIDRTAKHLIIGGLRFLNQSYGSVDLPSGPVAGDTYGTGATDIRITDSWFENVGQAKGSRNGVVRVGERCHRVRIDHNVFIHNYNHVRYRHGTGSLVSATKDGRVDHNYFGPAATDGFRDGVHYEIGAFQTVGGHVKETSDHLTVTFEYNVIEMPLSSKVDPETLEIKTNGMIVRNNIFDGTGGRRPGGGLIALRFSHYSTVVSNYCVGVGIKLSGAHHRIAHNYLNGRGTPTQRGIEMCRWGRRKPPDNNTLPPTHHNVIEHNTVLNTARRKWTVHGLRIGDPDFGAVRPIYDCVIRNNIVKSSQGILGHFDTTDQPPQTCKWPRSMPGDELGGSNSNIVFTSNYFENTGKAQIGNIRDLDTMQPPPASEAGLGSGLKP